MRRRKHQRYRRLHRKHAGRDGVVRGATRDGQKITYDSSVHSPQLADISTNDITWTREASATAQGTREKDLHDTADELDHTVSDTTESPDSENL